MRILIAHNFYRNEGGEDQHVRHLARLLRGSGHNIALFGPRSSEISRLQTAKQLIAQGGDLAQLRSLITNFRPDVVHLHNPYPGIGPRGVRLMAAAAPVVMTLHNYRLRCPNGLFYTRGQTCERCTRLGTAPAAVFNCLGDVAQSTAYALGHGLERIAGPMESHIAAFIAPSHFLSRKMVEHGLPPDRILHLPNFYPGRFYDNFDIGDTAVFAGRLTEEKGVRLLLEAVGGLDIPVRVLGDGPLKSELQSSAPSNVTFSGWVSESEVERAIRAARLVVVPSLSFENLPNVLLAAAASWTPAIAFPGGSVADFIRETGGGDVTTEVSSSALRSKLRSVWTQEDRLESWGKALGAFANAYLQPEAYARAIADIYEEIESGKPISPRTDD